MATMTMTLPEEPTTLYYYLEVKDGGIIQTYPGTAFEKRRKHVPHEMNVKDMRSIRDQFTLDKNGFELVDHKTNEKDFLDEEQVQNNYYPEVAQLIKEKTGASDVHIFSHMSRRHTFDEAQEDAAAKNDSEFVKRNNPARFVHVDQSYRGAEQILYLNLGEEEADKRINKRWAIINIWAPILKPVNRDPLAFCDYQSLDENDLRTVVANLPPPEAGEYGKVSKNMAHKPRADYSSNGAKGPVYEVANLAYNPNQRWYYADNMTPEELWLFKIFDSKKDGRARCAVHTSFPRERDQGPARTSVELRAFAFWDDEDTE